MWPTQYPECDGKHFRQPTAVILMRCEKDWAQLEWSGAVFTGKFLLADDSAS
jgi:hypothetical protein